MAVEKGKVITALDTKYKGKKSLSKHFKDSFAGIAADLIENDEGIEDYINNQDAFINLTISENDRRASEAVKKRNAELAAAATGEQTEGGQQNQEAEPDTEIGKLTKLVQSLTQTVSTMQQSQQSESIADRFKKDERLKGIPDFMIKRSMPQKDEDFETAITDLVADYKPFAEQNKLLGFGNDAPAGGGLPVVGGTAKPSPEVVKGVMAQL